MIETPRLILRPWREADKPAFEAIINTPAMMAHFGGVWAPREHDSLIDAQMASQEQDGFAMWAVEWRETGALIGICGLRRARHPDTPVTGNLEAGWRIAEPFWGRGVAREAAEASLDWGWRHTDHSRIIAYTTDSNARSWGLMQRLGMQRRADLDFRHPKFAADDPFGAMIVYAIERPSGELA
jgi:RimJ/RimL family protein N-acetyltransferase